MTTRQRSITQAQSARLNSVTTAPSNNLDDSWAVLTHSSIAGDSSDKSLSPVVVQPSDGAFPDVATLRQKFKESRVVHATVPLHLGNLTPEQILEINFLAGALVSKNPNIATDKLIADLAAIYSNKKEHEIESELAQSYFRQEPTQLQRQKEEFVPLDKGQNDKPDTASQSAPIEIKEIVTMAASKINLPPEKIEDFVEKLEDMEINYEHDLYNLTDAKLRSYGISDRMIVQIKKIVEELTIVRKIMNCDLGVSNEKAAAAPQLLSEKTIIPKKKVKSDPLDDDSDDSLDEDMWDCHGMGR